MAGFIGPEDQIEKLNSYETKIAMNLWACDLLQLWKKQINISPVLEATHKIMFLKEILKGIIKKGP